jgi:pantetheine-phosphate adenylyltransferase
METICLMTHEDFAFMTGSIVKEIFMLGGDVSGMVPPHVLKAMHRKRDKRGEDDDINVVSLRD